MTDVTSAVGTAWGIAKDLIGTPGHHVIHRPQEYAATYKEAADDKLPVEVIGNYVVYLTYTRNSVLTKMDQFCSTGKVQKRNKPKLATPLALYYQLVRAGEQKKGKEHPIHIRHCHLELTSGRRRNLFGEQAVLQFEIQCNDSHKGPYLLWTWEATTNGRSIVSLASEKNGEFSLFPVIPELGQDDAFELADGDTKKYFDFEIRNVFDGRRHNRNSARSSARKSGIYGTFEGDTNFIELI